MAAHRFVHASLLLSKSLRSVRCFALADGQEIPQDELDAETGAWVYYLCEK